MSEVICHNNGRYNLYFTVSDGFHWVSSISLDQLKKYFKEEFGNEGLRDLDNRLQRAHQTGTSYYLGNLESLLSMNRAGENEKHLSFKQCIGKFLT